MNPIANFLDKFAGFMGSVLLVNREYKEIKELSRTLTPEDKSIIKDLIGIHAANINQFEVKTNRIGSQVVDRFENLVRNGWIFYKEYEYQNKKRESTKIYYPSPKAYRFFRGKRQTMSL